MRPAHHITTSTGRCARGFSLIELMIAVAIVSILAVVAYPAFTDAIRKSRRSEAFASLSAVQQAQERWRAKNSSYAPDASLTLPAVPALITDPYGLGLSATTAGGYYGIAIDSATATDYSVTATATPGKSQALDGNCVRLRIRSVAGNLFYGSSAASGSFDESAGNRCWSK